MQKSENTSVLIAKIISYALTAPTFAFYCVILVVLFYPYIFHLSSIWLVILLSFLFLTVFPVVMIVRDARKGKVDLNVQDQSKRPIYFVYAMASHLTGSLIAYFLGEKFLFGFILSYFFVTLAIVIGNFFTKVSVHTSGITGPVTFLLLYIDPILGILYLLVIPVIWARIKLRAHTPIQTVLGIAISVPVTAIVFYFVMTLV